MLIDFRHGGTLQQKVLHLVFENAHQPQNARYKSSGNRDISFA